jgi:hypothetical protein
LESYWKQYIKNDGNLSLGKEILELASMALEVSKRMGNRIIRFGEY